MAPLVWSVLSGARFLHLDWVHDLMLSIRSGLSFTCVALQEAQRDEKAELHVCFRRAYDKVLKHDHSFVIRSVVTVRSAFHYGARN